MFNNTLIGKSSLAPPGTLINPAWLSKLLVLLLFLALITVAGTKVNPPLETEYQEEIPEEFRGPKDIVQSLIDAGMEHLGKPYRFKNEYGSKMDCSGYMAYLFAKHDISLPDSSPAIGKSVERIELSEAQKGDLLFFTGRNRHSKKVGHVGMVIENIGGDLKMLHSSQRGILIDDYPQNKYYRERFLFAGRVPQLTERIKAREAFEASRFKPVIVKDPIQEIKQEASLPPKRRQVSIIGVGDIMLGTDFPSRDFLPPNDGRDLLTPVQDILKGADIAFANLEGTFLSAAASTRKNVESGNSYAFKSPDHYVFHLRDAGIDLVSIANNHIGDFGDAGKLNTVKMLRQAGIEYAGLKEHPKATFTRDGVRYGFCAFAPNHGTVQLNDYKAMRALIKELDSVSDIVIVSFHGGGEGQKYRNLTKKKEYYLDEDRGNPHEFARVAIDAGADIVFGHGPHVPRAIDIYKDRFIAYSLGNFATYARFNLKGSNGIAPIIRVNVAPDGQFIDAQITSTLQTGEGGPVPDDTLAAVKEIKMLTKQDFPKSELMISDSGHVTTANTKKLAQQR